MTSTFQLALCIVLAGLCAGSPQVAGPCEVFFETLEAVPHVSLTEEAGPFRSLQDGQTFDGCEIEFETNDSIRRGVPIPDFSADPDSDLYRSGWRRNEAIVADGAGSGLHGIERGAVLCIIGWEQPAYIDDHGEFVESDTFSMWIQCRDRDARLINEATRPRSRVRTPRDTAAAYRTFTLPRSR